MEVLNEDLFNGKKALIGERNKLTKTPHEDVCSWDTSLENFSFPSCLPMQFSYLSGKWSSHLNHNDLQREI